MDSRTKKEMIGVGLIGTAVALGVAYANRRKIKRSYDTKKYNLLTWKDNITQDKTMQAEPLPEHIMNMIKAGGLIPFLEKTLK